MSVKTDRLGSNFVKVISEILATEIKDENIKFVTITSCDVTNDLSFAKVYFTVFDMDKKVDTIKALEKAKSFIRGEISKRINGGISHRKCLLFLRFVQNLHKNPVLLLAKPRIFSHIDDFLLFPFGKSGKFYRYCLTNPIQRLIMNLLSFC